MESISHSCPVAACEARVCCADLVQMVLQGRISREALENYMRVSSGLLAPTLYFGCDL